VGVFKAGAGLKAGSLYQLEDVVTHLQDVSISASYREIYGGISRGVKPLTRLPLPRTRAR